MSRLQNSPSAVHPLATSVVPPCDCGCCPDCEDREAAARWEALVEALNLQEPGADWSDTERVEVLGHRAYQVEGGVL
jgi:hypothetical protein